MEFYSDLKEPLLSKFDSFDKTRNKSGKFNIFSFEDKDLSDSIEPLHVIVLKFTHIGSIS